MRFRLKTALLGFLLFASGTSFAEEVYRNDFESAEEGKLPKEFMVMAGGFSVRAEGGNKFLELPGAPLDTFAFLFGGSQQSGVQASARFFGTKQGRKYPTFGISLNGVGGYRLQVSPAKKMLEIFKGDESRAQVPYDWESGKWVVLELSLAEGAGGGFMVEGRVKGEGGGVAATVRLEAKEALPSGRAGIWGAPYSGTEIRFDDLVLSTFKP
jgi:hypothetical protein